MPGNGSTPDWIAVDWGTSHCRAWAMSEDGSVLAEARSDRGMGSLTPDAFEPALLELVAPWLGAASVPVVACGMAGSRQGWIEAPYTPVPCRTDVLRMVAAPVRDPRLQVTVIGGIRQDSPADVMRGEETQIAGFLHHNKGFDGVLCMPGTHSKWVQISADEVVSFRTFMTGELYALLSEASVLRHSVGAGWDADAFAEAVSVTISRPEALAQRLFGIRAEGLLTGPDPAAASARLSGYLIGAELAASRPYWLGQTVVVIGARKLAGVYAAALEAQGVVAEIVEADAMTRDGLGAARALARETAG